MGFQLNCVCGKTAPVDAGGVGRPFTCRGCRARSVVVWGIDSKTKKAAPITLEATDALPRGFKIPLGMFELPCPCGISLFARPRQTGKRVQCPVCTMWLKLEHSKDPQSLETRIRVVKSRLNQLPTLPPKSAPPPAKVESILCTCGETLRVETSETGAEATCGACGRRIRLEMNQDSVSSCVVVDPKDPGTAPPDKPGFHEQVSLEDFN